MRGDAPQQHAGEVLLHRPGRLDVVARIEIERRDGGVDAAARERRFCLARAHRRFADAKKDQPHIREVLAVLFRGGRETDHRVVAVPPRQLREADARAGGRCRKAHRGQHVVRAERGIEQPLEEIVRLYGLLPLRPRDIDLAIERDETRGQFGGGICVSERAADGTAIADRRMSDMRNGKHDQRRVPGDLR